jgi:hypothetical protein
MKMTFVAAAATAVLTTAATPTKAQDPQGVDVQIGRDRSDRYDRDVAHNVAQPPHLCGPRLASALQPRVSSFLWGVAFLRRGSGEVRGPN